MYDDFFKYSIPMLLATLLGLIKTHFTSLIFWRLRIFLKSSSRSAFFCLYTVLLYFELRREILDRLSMIVCKIDYMNIICSISYATYHMLHVLYDIGYIRHKNSVLRLVLANWSVQLSPVVIDPVISRFF